LDDEERPNGQPSPRSTRHAHWSDLTSDPNSISIQKQPRAELFETHGGTIPNRIEAVADLCRDKIVLSMSCVDQVAEGLLLAPFLRHLSAGGIISVLALPRLS